MPYPSLPHGAGTPYILGDRWPATPSRWRRRPTVADTMPCAHGSTCHPPGGDRTHPPILRPGHGAGVGRCRPSSRPGVPPVSALQETCRRAEELGAGALWTCDHLFWHGPCLEAMMTLAVAATATERTTLGTCVVQLPLRQAPEVAKQAATLQALTLGRFVLGVGVGSHEGEYQQAGVDFHHAGSTARCRHPRATAVLGVRAGGQPMRHRGSRRGALSAASRAVAGAGMGGWLVGGRSPAGRRIGRWVDAVVPDPGRLRTGARAAGQGGRRAGRPVDAVTSSMVLFVSIDDDAAQSRRRGTRWMSSLYGIPAKAFERHWSRVPLMRLPAS